MKVLIACESSGTVRDAFIRAGHDAMSCDMLPTEQPGPHYQGDVRDVLYNGWDLLIGHPPCTYLSVSGIMCVPHAFVPLEPFGAKVWCEYHSYTGPTFYRSGRAIKEIEKPSKKTWDAYYKWRKTVL